MTSQTKAHYPDIAPEDVKQVGLFYRVSSLQQKKGETIKAQELLLPQWAEEEGWEVVVEFVEDGVSGELLLEARPEVQRCLAQAAQGRFQAVLFQEQSRIGRNAREAIDFADDLRRLGVLIGTWDSKQLADVNDPFAGLAIFTMKSASAQKDQADRINAQARGRYARALDGYWIGSNPPFGYKRTGNPGRYVLEADEKSAPIIKMAYELIAAGHSTSGAANEINEQFDFIPTKSVKAHSRMRWTGSHVTSWVAGRDTKLLDVKTGKKESTGANTSEVYVGLGYPKSIAPKRGGQPVLTRANAPAIVDQKLWKAAKVAIKTRTNAWRESLGYEDFTYWPYALSAGKGTKVSRIHHQHSDTEQVPMQGYALNHKYRCAVATPRWLERHPDAAECPGLGIHPFNHSMLRKTISTSLVDSHAILMATDALDSPESLAAVIKGHRRVERLTAKNQSAPTSEDLEAKVEKIAESLDRLEESYIRGAITQAKRVELSQELEENRRSLQAQMALALQAEQEEDVLRVTLEELLNVSMALPGVDAEERSASTDEESGLEVVEIPGFEDAVNIARDEAEAVLAGRQEQLPDYVIQWLRALADQIDLRVTLKTVEDPEALKGLGVEFHATAGIPLSGAAISLSSFT